MRSQSNPYRKAVSFFLSAILACSLHAQNGRQECLTIREDRSVVFRYHAPEAKSVKLQSDQHSGKRELPFGEDAARQ